MGGFIVGTIAGQFLGSWAYWQVRGHSAAHGVSEWLAATAAGVVATVVASAIYIPLGVHTWLGGEGTPWGAAVFMGVCVGICQGVLFRGSPLRPRPRATTAKG
jgi:hypothetical protein